ncbi:MAG: hypothetical protein H0U74_14720 [Bradymonadaceae bacterium]|nr:hypothetical protein [Lujinxingiaceae bacterium]
MTTKQSLVAILTALAATSMLAAGCGGGAECGTGTVERDGQCVPRTSTETLECGAGTILTDGACVLDNSGCGTDTVLEAGVCVPAASVCGVGTTRDSATGRCLGGTDIECGAGTTPTAGRCIPSAEACADKTRLQNGLCVIDPAICGTGTLLDANTGNCVATAVDVECGDGLAFTDGKCVATAELCAAGTNFVEATGLCLPDSTCKIGDEIIGGLCLSPGEVLAAHADTVNIDNGHNLTLPAVDDRFVFKGTIDAPTNGTQDTDNFTFTGAAGQWVKITVQSIGLQAPAFKVEGPAGMNYARWSPTDGAPSSARYVYVPYNGQYTVTVLPALVLESEGAIGPVGGEEWDYVGTLERIEAPAATELTVDAETEATISGTVTHLTQNLFSFTGPLENETLGFTLDALGANAWSSILVLTNTTPPSVVAVHDGLTAGASFFAPDGADLLILVDAKRVRGPQLDYAATLDIRGISSELTIPAGGNDLLIGVAPENSILKVTFESADIDEVSVSVFDADDRMLDEGALASDSKFYAFYSAGGEFAIGINNNSALAATLTVFVEIIKPEDLGTIVANSRREEYVATHRSDQDLFFLIETVPGQILEFSYDTGFDYTATQELVDDALWLDFWNEDGSRGLAESHIIQPTPYIYPEERALTQSRAGQYMAIRIGQAFVGELCTQSGICNRPYDRTGYTFEIDSQTYSFNPATGGYEGGDSLETTSTAILEDYRSHFLQVTFDEPVTMSGQLTAEIGDVDFVLYNSDLEFLGGKFTAGDENLSDFIFEPGSYFFRVLAFDELSEGYMLNADFTFNGPIAIEDFSATYEATATDGINGSQAWFTIEVDEPTALVLTGTYVAGSGDGWLRLTFYDEANNVLDESLVINSGNTVRRAGAVLQPGQVYSVRLGGNEVSFNDPATVRVTVNTTFDGFKEEEPNNTAADADYVGQLGASGLTAFGTTVGLESDFFSFYVPIAGDVFVGRFAMGPLGASSATLTVRDSAENPVVLTSGVAQLAMGTYTVELKRASAGIRGNSYELYVEYD